ncbi:hypothetical protein PENSPDRAFT_593945 [Peniophora sp. CONT]|nr:hypothetical protein PENSPDRAFT_593945 [Peniophora sp. CONT]
MSDSVVLWRMCAVWENARPVIAFGAALLITTLVLNINNINANDSEIIPTYGAQYVGLAAAFVSLASNLCATILVGIKAWYAMTTLISKHLRYSGNRRTAVQRVMELLVDSGVVYTAIWVAITTHLSESYHNSNHISAPVLR